MVFGTLTNSSQWILILLQTFLQPAYLRPKSIVPGIHRRADEDENRESIKT
jgi:hypothetical protein